MPVKLDYSAFSSLHCSMKMPMWRIKESRALSLGI